MVDGQLLEEREYRSEEDDKFRPDNLSLELGSLVWLGGIMYVGNCSDHMKQ